MASGSRSIRFARRRIQPATTFLDAIDVVYDATIPYDLRFFQSLDRFVQQEPWLTRDKAMIDQLKSIGIEKGKPFDPDAKTQDILNAAAREAHALLELTYETHVHALFRRSAVGCSRRRPSYHQGRSTDGFAGSGRLSGRRSRSLPSRFAFFTPKHSGLASPT